MRIPAPTPLALKVLVLPAGLAAAGLFLPPAVLLWKASLAGLGVWLLISMLVRPRRDAVSVERTLIGALHVGRSTEALLHIQNRFSMLLHCKIRDVASPQLFHEHPLLWCLSVKGGEEKTLSERLTPLSRGNVTLGPAAISLAFPWSLLAFGKTLKDQHTSTALPGRPAGETAQLISATTHLAEAGQRKLKLRGQDQEFDCLSDYVTGDEIRHIDWKASSRRMKPQVRRFRLERNAELILALDCGRLMGTMVGGIRKLDLAITPLLDFAAVALKRGERVALVTFSSKVHDFLPSRSGLGQLSQLRHTLARLETDYDHTSYERCAVFLKEHHPRRSMIVMFTDFTDKLSAQAVLVNLAVLSRSHLILFAGVNDRHIETTFRASPANTDEIFQKAVAADLLTERRTVLEELHRLGAYVVDGDPQHLSAPMINAYLEIRLRGLL